MSVCQLFSLFHEVIRKKMINCKKMTFLRDEIASNWKVISVPSRHHHRLRRKMSHRKIKLSYCSAIYPKFTIFHASLHTIAATVEVCLFVKNFILLCRMNECSIIRDIANAIKYFMEKSFYEMQTLQVSVFRGCRLVGCCQKHKSFYLNVNLIPPSIAFSRSN